MYGYVQQWWSDLLQLVQIQAGFTVPAHDIQNAADVHGTPFSHFKLTLGQPHLL